MKKELNVSALKNGTVIDHIPAKALFNVINILKLEKCGDGMITFGTNLDSNRFGQNGKKGIIKIADVFFEESDINKIALVAPTAVLNVIKDYEVADKKKISMPKTIIGIVKCQNPVCVTNNEPVMQKYEVVSSAPVALRCYYCEKVTEEHDFKLID